MIGVLIVAAASLFGEIADSIGKFEVSHKQEGLYGLLFLNLLPATAVFAAIAVFGHAQFTFTLASWPTFLPRLILEIIQSHLTVRALATADRSTFSFVRLGTIPLLIITDLALGNIIRQPQWIGITVITASLVVLLLTKELGRRGLGFALFSAVNAAAVLTLYKYDITHYNSVAAEQGIVNGVLLLYFFGAALLTERQRVWDYFRNRALLAQSSAVGLYAVLVSYAYLYGAASVITTASRSLAVFWSILFGRKYFAETHIIVKMLALVLIVVGLSLLAWP